jgi:hypothetical protein
VGRAVAAVNPVENEELAALRAQRATTQYPLGDLPFLIITRGFQRKTVPMQRRSNGRTGTITPPSPRYHIMVSRLLPDTAGTTFSSTSRSSWCQQFEKSSRRLRSEQTSCVGTGGLTNVAAQLGR